MKILHGSDISKSIALVNPERVAVAYIGVDWKKYIPDYEKLKSIIISPTLGSNPYAIKELVSVLGWEKVFFLDELHAKLYLGAELAVMGSANLTSNGLLGTKLEELCCEVDDLEQLPVLKSFYEDMIEKSKKKYPDLECKKARLSRCFDEWNKSVSNGVVKESLHKNDFESFDLFSDDQFYVAWYCGGSYEYSDEVKAVESVVANEICLANDDQVEKNKWVLIWRITERNLPDRRTNPMWLYIHEIFENGVIEETGYYNKLAVQRSDLELPNVPFELTGSVVGAFRSAVVNKRNEPYFVRDDNNVFYMKNSKGGMYQLIEDMRVEIGVR